MSGFPLKRKKYSWLPESNPAAVSGDAASPTLSSSKKSESSEKTARAPRSRSRGGGKERAKEKEKAADNAQRTESNGSDGAAMVVDILGISTPAPKAASTTPPSNDASEEAASTAADGDADGDAKQKPEGVASKMRRRPRKDSVDDLVRSRFMSTLSAQQDGSSGMSRARKRGTEPAPSSITASVRDALASERSGHMRVAGSNGAPHDASTMSLPAMVDGSKGGRPRTAAGHRMGHHLSHGKAASSVSTPGQTMAAPQPRLGALESKYSFPTYASLNPRNVTSTLRRGDQGVGVLGQTRGLEVTTGENVIVINAGSRWLRIGRANDAVPREIPHVIARRVSASGVAQVPAAPSEMDVDRGSADRVADGGSGSQSSGGSDGDDDDGGDSDDDMVGSLAHGGAEVASTLKMLRDALKQHQRQSKRKVPANVYSQVLSYNKQSRPETIADHNDPFRVEWIPASEIEDDCVVGERVFHMADIDSFVVRHPIRNGYLNVEDYASIEEVLGDIETIWTTAIRTELGINRRDLGAFGAVLVIPDMFNRVEVIALAEMLLRRMGFGHLLVQQSSTLVTFGAGFSTACVVDVGAQKTSIACIEDGFCYQESRVTMMYGGDDITRFLYHLFMASSFPYREASLDRMYDWRLLNDLRERYCTMNLSDVNIRLRDFFVRIPNHPTRKLSFKTYDEPYQALLCLFYPAIVAAFSPLPDYSHSFANSLHAETHGEAKPVGCSADLAPTQFAILPARAVDAGSESAPRKPTPEAAMSDPSATATATESAIVPAAVPPTEPGSPDLRDQQAEAASTDISGKDALQPDAAPSVSYVPDVEAQYSRMPLDAAITHSIVHAGSMDRAKKLYSSIVIVGGGVSFVPGFSDLLSARVLHLRPDYLQGVERAEIVSAPRDLDPRVLAWKGGAVLSRLECARELWISAREWADFGPRFLRDRVLFPW
ncbi:actin-like protein arp8 [Coemansia sp. RSA 1200]|nr:actin-like protein arp8 [Coemansia sp. RSA 1200]